MSGLIPTSKQGDCSRCSATNTAVRKRQKDLLCLKCCREDDTKARLAKARERTLVTSLIATQQMPKGTAELQRWFEARHKEMTGRCKHCNGVTQAGKSNYKNSIAHLLPKAYFPSVATHEMNWIELCFYGNSCHANLDNMMLDLIDLNCFSEVVQKFCIMYPSIAINERRRIPAVLLQYIETEK